DAISRLPGTFGSGQSLIHSSSARTQPPRGPDAASIKTEREYRMAHGSTDALRLEREGEAGVRNGAGAEPDHRGRRVGCGGPAPARSTTSGRGGDGAPPRLAYCG